MNLSSIPLKALLSIPAAGYHTVQVTREKAYAMGLVRGRKAPVPVISVGNILMGGSGKTPFAIWLAESLFERGARPAVVSRGYRGANKDPFLVVGDGRSTRPLVGPDVCGDEPYLIARRIPNIPVIIGRRRIDPVTAAHDLFRPGVVILDDGFQHLQLERDADIVLLNGSEDRMFPAGRLREPFSALRRADFVALVGSESEIPRQAGRYISQLPVFRCYPTPVAVEGIPGVSRPEDLAGEEVLLVSGIAGPERFALLADGLGWRTHRHLAFPDHHVFSDADLKRILEEAGPRPVVFTEKDWVKLPEWFTELSRVGALILNMEVPESDAFLAAIEAVLERHSPKPTHAR